MSSIEALGGEESDDDALVWVDHREEDDSIIESLSRRLGAEDAITLEWRGDVLWARHRGREHRVPLTFTPHDRYVAIGSVAALVKDRYALYVSKSSLQGDTHGLAVLPHAEVAAASDAARQALGERFIRIEPGIDHFGGPALPYVGHEDHNPDFAAQAAAFDQAQREAMQALLASPRMQAVRGELQDGMRTLQPRRRWRLVLSVVLWVIVAFWIAIRFSSKA